MPQIMPMNWIILTFMFTLTLLIIMKLNFYNMKYFKKYFIQSSKINWKW